MIYTYKHLPHAIEGFQTEMSYFFEQLFANDLAVYDEAILLGPNFAQIINKSPVRLKDTLKKIAESYHTLTNNDKKTLKRAFVYNSKISQTCADNRSKLIKYEAINDKAFLNLLKNFLTMLWEDYPQNELMEAAYGNVKSHFDSMIDPDFQSAFVCPFCGLLSLKPKGLYRNAYDHFIPKAQYPFVSINFQNLFPICTDCNSDEKKTTDTLYNNVGGRRKALHPLDLTYDQNQLDIKITTSEDYNALNLKTLLRNINWEYAIKYAGKTDPRLTTWDEVFHIKRRYREHILQYERIWFDEFLVKRYKQDMQDGLSFDRFKEKIIDESRDQIILPLGMLRFVYFNFLFSSANLETQLQALWKAVA